MFAARRSPMRGEAALDRSLDIAAELAALLAIVPLLAAVVGSIGAQNYVQWWGTTRGWNVLWRTVALAGPATIVALSMAWALVASAMHLPRRWAGAVALLSCLGMLVPSSTLATTWLAILAPGSLVGGALARAGFGAYSTPVAAVVLAMRYFGIAAVILMYHQSRQGRLASVQGVFRIPRWRAVRLHLPPAARATAVAGLLVMLFCMNDHIIPGMFLISTYGPQVMIQYSALLDPAGAAALGVPIAAVGVGLAGAALLLGRKIWPAAEAANSVTSSPTFWLRRAFAGVVVVIILAVAVGLPIGVLMFRAGSPGAPMRALWAARDQMWQTLYCVVVAGAICTVVGALLARRWARARQAGGFSAVPLVLLNLTAPASLLGIGMIQASQYWPGRGMSDSSWLLILGYVARFVPVATLGLLVAWRNEAGRRAPAAELQSISRWRRMLHIDWVQRRAAVGAVAVLCGLLIATELEVSIMLAPAGKATLGIHLYTLIHAAPDSLVSALTVGILILAGPGVLALALLLSAARRAGGNRQR